LILFSTGKRIGSGVVRVDWFEIEKFRAFEIEVRD
jgi:hypothetical protein